MHVRCPAIAPPTLACVIVACGGAGASDRGGSDSSGDSTDATTGTTALRYEQFSFAGITLSDESAGFAWYRDVLGLEPQNGHWFGLADGRTAVELFDGGSASAEVKPPAQQSAVIGLQVPDLDASKSALEARGVAFLGPIDGSAPERWIYLNDPEGNRLELKQLGAAGSGLEVSRIAWASVFVEDLDGMTMWYRETLGLEQVGSQHYYELADGSTLELFAGGTAAAATKDAATQSTVFALVVADLDAALAELAGRGVEMIEPIVEYQEQSWPDERSTMIADPEGNRILLKQFTE